MPLKESVTLDEVLEVLNSAIKADPDAMKLLIENRVECNEELADHPTIQVGAVGDHHEAKDGLARYSVGLLGILNGLFGINDVGWGAIAAHFNVECPDGCQVVDNLRVGDQCPDCGKELVLGDLLSFCRANIQKKR